MSYDWKFLTDIQKSVFDGIEVQRNPGQITGWMADEFPRNFEQFEKSYNKDDILTVIEVGTWKGLSANTMANICKAYHVNAKIVCIDTWLGSPEHMEGESASYGMQRINGIPTLFMEFAQNTKTARNNDIIYPFPISSVQGAIYLERKNMVADMIYIDAGHEYDSVLLDIKSFWPMVKSGGRMVCDDWKWPGVKSAILDFFQQRDDCDIQIGEFQVVIVKTK